MKNTGIINESQAFDAIMSILNDAPETKAKATEETFKILVDARAGKGTKADKQLKEADKKPAKEAPMTVYQNGIAIEVNGKKTTTGPKKKGGKRTAKADAGRDKLRDLAKEAMSTNALYNKKVFEHSTEGLVISLLDADYTIKVSKSKENKFDTTEKDFEAEKDFTVRGKAINRAPGIAKTLLAALDDKDLGCEYTLCQAKASGITIQMKEGEYTFKISKKRDRIGFEAERAAAYDK